MTELILFVKAISSLLFVFAILYISLKILQKYSKIGANAKLNNKESGLKVQNIVYIDEGNKIVTLKCNNGYNYIVSMGKNNTCLIDKYKQEDRHGDDK